MNMRIPSLSVTHTAGSKVCGLTLNGILRTIRCKGLYLIGNGRKQTHNKGAEMKRQMVKKVYAVKKHTGSWYVIGHCGGNQCRAAIRKAKEE